MSFTPFLMTLLNFVFGQSRFWKFLHGLVVAVPVETVRFERSIHFNDCNTSWVNLNIVSLYKPVSLTKIKVLCCLNVDDLLSRTLLLTIVTSGRIRFEITIENNRILVIRFTAKSQTRLHQWHAMAHA